MNLSTDKLLTRTEVCKTLGISMGTFHSMVKTQKLPVVEIGRRVFVKQSALESWIDSKEKRR